MTSVRARTGTFSKGTEGLLKMRGAKFYKCEQPARQWLRGPSLRGAMANEAQHSASDTTRASLLMANLHMQSTRNHQLPRHGAPCRQLHTPGNFRAAGTRRLCISSNSVRAKLLSLCFEMLLDAGYGNSEDARYRPTPTCRCVTMPLLILQ